MKRLGIALAVATLAAPARAQTSIDGMEHIFGASNTNAVAGHGGLTAGISADGDVTVLSWPSPSYYDQLAYVASNALDVRDQPHMGALDGMGSYVGLMVDSGSGPTLTWLRDAPWTHVQAYTRDDAPVPITTFRRDDLGLTVALTDVVSPDVDVLTRRVVVTRDPGSPVTSASLVVYENLSPTLSKIPQFPVADWALDARNDFFALYDAQQGAIVHFHPGDRAIIDSLFAYAADPTQTDYGPVEALMKQATPADADVDALLGSLDSDYAPGVAALVTTEPAPTEFQVGSDATPICQQLDTIVTNITKLPDEFPGTTLPVDPSTLEALKCTDMLDAVRAARGWTYQPEDALADLADGTLSGSRVAAGQTNGALVAPLVFSGDTAEGSVDFAFGETLAAARTALATAKAEPASARQTASEAAAAAALDAARLPDASLGSKVVRIAERALVNLYVARDRSTGAIVASIARQPPYYLDWPRDGAFFDAALDVAGLLPWATMRTTFYAGLQRTDITQGNPFVNSAVPTDPTTGDVGFPADVWEMNYFADGIVGGPIRFEIDNTGMHLFSLSLHAATLDASDRADYVTAIWPSSKRALDRLLDWMDPATGLPAPANEDDHLELTSELQGAIAVYSALVGGARLGHVAGDDLSGGRYAEAAAALHDVILSTYFDPSAQLFTDTRGATPRPGEGTVGWAIWPGRILPPGDPRLEHQLDADMDAILSILEGNAEGGSYTAKNILAAAIYGADGGSRDKARQALELLADAATPDTLQFGETYVVTSKPGDPLTWSERVAPPHVWQGILFYLSAMALTDPAPFTVDESLPMSPPLQPLVAGGCSCRASSGDGGTGGVAALLLLVGAVVERKRIFRLRAA
jgi:MYXO-CTERM domain-containing protein